jgi:hypothetical protein
MIFRRPRGSAFEDNANFASVPGMLRCTYENIWTLAGVIGPSITHQSRDFALVEVVRRHAALKLVRFAERGRATVAI